MPNTAMERYDRNTMSFSDLAGTADQVEGNELVKDEILRELEGVPFLITHVTFRPSFPSQKNKELWLAYVSCEAVIADEAYLASHRKMKNLDGKPFGPGEHIVFNDGSTGIYRQIVDYLDTKGYIVAPQGKKEGPKEESRFDSPPSEWEDVNYGDTRFPVNGGPPGFVEYAAEIRLLCPRGLRTSDYQNDFTNDGTTHYIA